MQVSVNVDQRSFHTQWYEIIGGDISGGRGGGDRGFMKRIEWVVRSIKIQREDL